MVAKCSNAVHDFHAFCSSKSFGDCYKEGENISQGCIIPIEMQDLRTGACSILEI